MNEAGDSTTRLRHIARRVWADALAADFRGADPYDGLQSGLLSPLLKRSRLLRLAVIQGVKRSPVNLRPLLRIPPGTNPKGLALFISGAADHPAAAAGTSLESIIDRLLVLASRPAGEAYFGTRSPWPGLAASLAEGRLPCDEPLGWGYDFAWQSRAFLQPPFYPTVVATSFAVDALADSASPAYRAVLLAAARFVVEHLHRHEAADGICFSYSPRDRSRVLNASLFAAKILARAAALPATSPHYGELARLAAGYAAARQRTDGSWWYGESQHWTWIDNLHTGFVLETLAFIAGALQTSAWDSVLARGLEYYRNHLFRVDGTPRYYPDRDYPLDGHTVAQSALTFLALARFDGEACRRARTALHRGIAELWDEARGAFLTRLADRRRDRTIYLRWSQAWMFRALCAWLASEETAR